MMRQHALSLQSSAAGRANLRTYINAAKAAGFDCIEPTKVQLDYFFKAGYTPEDVKSLLGNMEIASIGWLSDIERQGHGFVTMMKEAEQLFSMASSIGSHAIEIINGPVDWHAVDCYRRGIPYNGYMGLQGIPETEQHQIIIHNMRALADLAAQFHLSLFFEPLCWTPVPSLREGIPLVEQAERENLKIVVDFYHNYVAGLNADFLSKINQDIILGIHVCNSREPDDRIPCEEIFRDVALYEGAVPIKEWVDAIKSTGFHGWWAYETFSKREVEEDVYDFAAYIHGELKKLIYD